MRYLLDTNVISELVARQPDPAVLTWIEALDQTAIYLSVITIGEIHRGIERLPESAKRDRLRAWLTEDLLVRFADRIVPIDVGVMMAWGSMVARLISEGRPLSAMDSLIAAQAIHHRYSLVTRNESDFRDTGVNVMNPWR
ncbi:MAG TPA: type II toxin-antitoxin system VapC family toxin [Armatimonadota bacterium]|nr:type II toxin-antitoxin system VapC family toxin [Armatimonadota bacterium]